MFSMMAHRGLAKGLRALRRVTGRTSCACSPVPKAVVASIRTFRGDEHDDLVRAYHKVKAMATPGSGFTLLDAWAEVGPPGPP